MSKQKERIAYKVVDSELRSVGLLHISRYSIQYKIGEWVKPKLKKSRLFVCDNIKDAISGSNHLMDTRRIYKCKIRNWKKLNTLGMPDDEGIEAYWKNTIINGYPGNQGTLGAKEVMLLERVQ